MEPGGHQPGQASSSNEIKTLGYTLKPASWLNLSHGLEPE